MVSVYFRDAKEWQLVKRAAKIRKIKPSVFMRERILAEAERVIARGGSRPKAA